MGRLRKIIFSQYKRRFRLEPPFVFTLLLITNHGLAAEDLYNLREWQLTIASSHP